MISILVIGMTGEGKSEFAKQFIKDRNCLVFDVQNEYGMRTKYKGQVPVCLPEDTKLPRSRYTRGDEKEFINIALTKMNTAIVFEEATIFFEGKTDTKLRRALINKLHSGNAFVFMFHSIASVPPRIMQLTNYIVLYKTADEENEVKRKFNRLLPHYIGLKGTKQGTNKIIKNI